MGFLPFFCCCLYSFSSGLYLPIIPGSTLTHRLDLTWPHEPTIFLRKERKTVWVSLSLFTNHLFSCFVKKPLTSYLPQQEEKKIDSKRVSILLFRRNFLRPTRYIGEHFGPAVQGRFFFRVFSPSSPLLPVSVSHRSNKHPSNSSDMEQPCNNECCPTHVVKLLHNAR